MTLDIERSLRLFWEKESRISNGCKLRSPISAVTWDLLRKRFSLEIKFSEELTWLT